MENNGYKNNNYYSNNEITFSKNIFTRVMFYMFFGLILTGAISFGISYFYIDIKSAIGSSFEFIVLISLFVEIFLVISISSRLEKKSIQKITTYFFVYSILNGITLSFIFLFYDLGNIALAFSLTAGTFGLMAILGATTSIDLTKYGPILITGLFIAIIASLINFLIGNSALDTLICVAMIILFSALTAYDIQKIRRFANHSSDINKEKIAIVGALMLYLDFINIFLLILRLLSKSKK